MRYISTRGLAPEADFETVIVEGLAPDGGLYVPTSVPQFSSAEMAALAGADLGAVTLAILGRFTGSSISDRQLTDLLSDCHAQFTHPQVTPLHPAGAGRWIMELFHGPTLAFKDLSMQVMAPLLGHFLQARGRNAFIIGATSGDTGGAALAAFAQCPDVHALFLYPDGGVSTYQESQMLALSDEKRRAVPVDGSFDDCQRLVKAMLSSSAARGAFRLTAVNSVNWGRILAQSAYFARTALTLADTGKPVHFVVPTGNYGNVYSGLLARRMGFPVGEIVLATNENDSLDRLVRTGTLQPRQVVRTNTPAIDIQLASNIERTLFDLSNGDAAAKMRATMGDLAAGRRATLGHELRSALAATHQSISISAQDTLSEIAATYRQTGYLADPHTALAIAAANRVVLPPGDVVVLSTAHPIKFAETMVEALGSLPPGLQSMVQTVATRSRGLPIAADSGQLQRMVYAMCAA
jgi:threonine synthase